MLPFACSAIFACSAGCWSSSCHLVAEYTLWQQCLSASMVHASLCSIVPKYCNPTICLSCSVSSCLGTILQYILCTGGGVLETVLRDTVVGCSTLALCCLCDHSQSCAPGFAYDIAEPGITATRAESGIRGRSHNPPWSSNRQCISKLHALCVHMV